MLHMTGCGTERAIKCCLNNTKKSRSKFFKKIVNIKETRQSVCDAVVQWMMATHFKLTLLARVHFPPHKPYIVVTFTHNMNFKTVRTMVNGEPRIQHCKSSHLSEHVSLRLHTMQSQPKLRSCQRGQHLCITCLGNMRSTLMLRNNIGLYYLYHRIFIQLLTCNITAGLQKATVTMFRIVHTPCVQCLITARLSRYVYVCV